MTEQRCYRQKAKAEKEKPTSEVVRERNVSAS